MTEPKIRFRQDDGSEYPDWVNYPMSEIFDEISEKNHPEMQVLSVQQGVGTVLRDSSDRNILYDKSNLKNYKAMRKDDFIIHLRSFEGGLECSNYDGISSPAYRILRPVKILSQAYRDYFRSHEFIKNKLAVSVVGIRDGKNIDMDTFWEIPMTIPAIDEQQKIADFLTTVDEVISASEEEVTILETQKKAVMQKIFSQQVRFKKPDGTDFPDWEEKSINEICVINPKCEEIPEKFYYMDLGSVDHGIWVNPNVINKKDAPSRAQRTGQQGDVFFQSVRPYNQGHFYLSSLLDKNIVASTGYIQMRMYNGIDSKFIYQYLYSPKFNSEVNIRCTGSNYPAINSEKFSEIVINVPDFEEQRLIADFLSNFDETIAMAKKELELWKQLKKALLQQMFV